MFLFKGIVHIEVIFIVQEGERVVSKKEGIEFAREYGCLFLECSAKTRVNVEQCFEELVLKVCKLLEYFVYTLFFCVPSTCDSYDVHQL